MVVVVVKQRRRRRRGELCRRPFWDVCWLRSEVNLLEREPRAAKPSILSHVAV